MSFYKKNSIFGNNRPLRYHFCCNIPPLFQVSGGQIRRGVWHCCPNSQLWSWVWYNILEAGRGGPADQKIHWGRPLGRDSQEVLLDQETQATPGKRGWRRGGRSSVEQDRPAQRQISPGCCRLHRSASTASKVDRKWSWFPLPHLGVGRVRPGLCVTC